MLILVAVWSETYVCSLLTAVVAGSNSATVLEVSFLCLLSAL